MSRKVESSLTDIFACLAAQRIDEAIKQAEKAAKSKRILEVPTIALHDRVADKEERQKERAKKRRGKGKGKGKKRAGGWR